MRRMRRQRAGWPTRQPVACEARNDAAADHGDEEDSRSDTDAHSVAVGAAWTHAFQMEYDVADQQQADQRQNLEILPAVCVNDFSADHARKGGKEQNIDRGRGRGADPG